MVAFEIGVVKLRIPGVLPPKIDALDAAMRATMYALFNRYYASVNTDLFIHDLEGKTIAILLRDGDGELQGFSTLEVINFETDSGPATRRP